MRLKARYYFIELAEFTYYIRILNPWPYFHACVVMRYVQGVVGLGGRHHGKIQVLRKHLGSEELGHRLTNEHTSIYFTTSHWCAASSQALRCLYKRG